MIAQLFYRQRMKDISKCLNLAVTVTVNRILLVVFLPRFYCPSEAFPVNSGCNEQVRRSSFCNTQAGRRRSTRNVVSLLFYSTTANTSSDRAPN